MKLGQEELSRTLGEFFVFLAVLVGGSLIVVWTANQFTPPINAVVNGAAVVATAAVGYGWLRWTAPATDQDWDSPLTGFSAICGVLAIQRFAEGNAYTALGIGVGALLVIGSALFFIRRSP